MQNKGKNSRFFMTKNEVPNFCIDRDLQFDTILRTCNEGKVRRNALSEWKCSNLKKMENFQEKLPRACREQLDGYL